MCRDNCKWSRVCAVRFYLCFRIVTWQIVWCDPSEILDRSQHRLWQKKWLRKIVLTSSWDADLKWLHTNPNKICADGCQGFWGSCVVRQKEMNHFTSLFCCLLPEELKCHCMMSSVLLCCSLWCVRYRMRIALSPLAHVNRGACLYSATWLTPPRHLVLLPMRRQATHQPHTTLF